MFFTTAMKIFAILAFSVITVLGSPRPMPQAPVSSAPVGTPAPDGEYPIPSNWGFGIGGALDPTPIPTAAIGGPNIAPPPEYLTISWNPNRGKRHRSSEYPAVGQVEGFAVPTNWAGRVAVAEAQYGDLTDGRLVSLIEANFDVPLGYTVAVPDVDVSFVDAYSVPITCSCAGTVVTGCNRNLLALSSCPSGMLEAGSCYNPLKPDAQATAPTAFFAPCNHAAYTYPADSLANSFGQCQNGYISCCIGTACPADPKQPA
ncbi:hypothetical protein F5Y16DRAFT_404154 [Xylariaceae sp. FL0255]|nr:hypothetical protein F5Y16DRAFT_404154 [Xylariaceae sp. FL0255]